MAQARAPRPRAEMMNEVEHVTKPRNCMKTSFFKIFWDESSWIISIAWKEATSAMTDGIQSRASHTALEIYDVDLPRITSDED